MRTAPTVLPDDKDLVSSHGLWEPSGQESLLLALEIGYRPERPGERGSHRWCLLLCRQGPSEKQNKQNQHRRRYRRRYITEIGSFDDGAWEIPQSAICKLENQKASGAIQSEAKGLRTFLGPEEPRTRSSDRARENGCPGSRSSRKCILPLPFCSLRALNRLDDAHAPWWGWSLYSVHWIKC